MWKVSGNSPWLGAVQARRQLHSAIINCKRSFSRVTFPRPLLHLNYFPSEKETSCSILNLRQPGGETLTLPEFQTKMRKVEKWWLNSEYCIACDLMPRCISCMILVWKLSMQASPDFSYYNTEWQKLLQWLHNETINSLELYLWWWQSWQWLSVRQTEIFWQLLYGPLWNLCTLLLHSGWNMSFHLTVCGVCGKKSDSALTYST